jgi:cell division protein FtsL
MASTSAARVATPARTRSPSPPARRPAARPRARRSAGLTSGVVWIVLVAALLAGVVAMNVTVLRLNVRLDELGRQRASLQAENAALASQLSSAAALARIQGLARGRLGLVPADPTQTIYVQLGRRRK